MKDFIIRKGGIEKVSISKTLIKNSQNSHPLYKPKLAEENRQKWEAAENANRIEEDNQKATEIEEIDNNILMIKSGIKIAEKSIKERNLKLEKQLKQSNMNKDALASAHGKVSMSLKRKNELKNSLNQPRSKRKSWPNEFARFLDYRTRVNIKFSARYCDPSRPYYIVDVTFVKKLRFECA